MTNTNLTRIHAFFERTNNWSNSCKNKFDTTSRAEFKKANLKSDELCATANNQSPWKDFKVQARVRNPLKVPEIGDKLGELLEHAPLVRGTCYATAMFIATSIPGVNIVSGVISTHSLKRKTPHPSMGALASQEFVVNEMMEKETQAKAYPLQNRRNSRNGWFNFGKDQQYYEHDNQLYLTHAWNEYKGIHFDVLAHLLYREVGAPRPLWWSVRSGELIHWSEYRFNKIWKDFNKNPSRSKVIRTLGLLNMVFYAQRSVKASFEERGEWPYKDVLWSRNDQWLNTGEIRLGNETLLVSGSL